MTAVGTTHKGKMLFLGKNEDGENIIQVNDGANDITFNRRELQEVWAMLANAERDDFDKRYATHIADLDTDEARDQGLEDMRDPLTREVDWSGRY